MTNIMRSASRCLQQPMWCSGVERMSGKVGGKVFAIGGWTNRDTTFITFKCTPIAFEMLQEESGLRPAPYLAPRGGKWIQMYDEPGLSNEDMQLYLAASHNLVVQKLTRKLWAELKLEDL